MIRDQTKKLENITFFEEMFKKNISVYENEQLRLLKPGDNELFYLNDSGYTISYTASINSDNFRGKEHNTTKMPETIRVIIVGDSHTFGWGLEDDETFSYKLEQILNERLPESNWEVLNMGIYGYNLIQKLKFLKTKGLKYDPDIVILQLDADDDYPQKFSDWEREIFDSITHQNQLEDITDCNLWEDFDTLRVNFEKQYGSEELSNNYIIVPLDWLKKLQGTHNFSVFIFSFWPEYTTIYNEPIEHTAIENKSIDNNWLYFENFDILEDDSYYISKYERHLNSTGHEMIANYLYDVISR